MQFSGGHTAPLYCDLLFSCVNLSVDASPPNADDIIYFVFNLRKQNADQLFLAISLIKATGIHWFGFSLLVILMAFNDIYTPILLGGIFSPRYLKEYLISYLWGRAIALGVNILVSSGRELCETLVKSLEHISTFAALIAKGYSFTGTEEEHGARKAMAQTVKADFTFLTEKIDETSIEINWSKFSMDGEPSFLLFPCTSLPLLPRLPTLRREGPSASVQPDHCSRLP